MQLWLNLIKTNWAPALYRWYSDVPHSFCDRLTLLTCLLKWYWPNKVIHVLLLRRTMWPVTGTNYVLSVQLPHLWWVMTSGPRLLRHLFIFISGYFHFSPLILANTLINMFMKYKYLRTYYIYITVYIIFKKVRYSTIKSVYWVYPVEWCSNKSIIIILKGL